MPAPASSSPAYARRQPEATLLYRTVQAHLETFLARRTDEGRPVPRFVEPGSPWENGYVESLNGKLRDELLDREIFFTLLEARILIERWRWEYNHVRPHSSLGQVPPAPEAIEGLAPGGAKRSLAALNQLTWEMAR